MTECSIASGKPRIFFCPRCKREIARHDRAVFEELDEGRCLVIKLGMWCRFCSRWFVLEERTPQGGHEHDPDAFTLYDPGVPRYATAAEAALAHKVNFTQAGQRCYAYRLVVVE